MLQNHFRNDYFRKECKFSIQLTFENIIFEKCVLGRIELGKIIFENNKPRRELYSTRYQYEIVFGKTEYI